MKVESLNHNFPMPFFRFAEQAKDRICEHPLLRKVARKANGAFHAGQTIPASISSLAQRCVATVQDVTKTCITSTAELALLAIDTLVFPHHAMKNHAFTPRQCNGGRLYYDGDVPILTLTADDPFLAGMAHGYLCGEAINRLSKRFSLALHSFAKQPRPGDVPHMLATVRRTVSPKYLKEMEGLVEGYNKWAREQHWWILPKTITVDDVLLFHLLPDSCHLDHQEAERVSHPSSPSPHAVACTAIIDQDDHDTLVFARNMDWPSLGMAGTFSLVVNRKHSDGRTNTVEVGIPGLIGVLTGMNSQGLSIAMNVCSGNTDRIKGMPAVLYNRACLEQCRDIKSVEKFVRRHSPLGPYHLTVADIEGAASFHLDQSRSSANPHAIRRWKKGFPLITLNALYTSTRSGRVIQSDHEYFDVEREKTIKEFFRHRRVRPLESALALPFVNNALTTHRVVMTPKTKALKVAFDNTFAGGVPLHSVCTEDLL